MTTEDGSLASGYRAIRTVREREDAPWPGILARDAGGDAWLLVDAEVLGPTWGGWEAPPDGHVLAPLDVARRADGHDVVLPVCSERLEDFVRRRSGRVPLSRGEAVTLGVSLLRGCAQISARPDTAGEWWLAESGRPVLATDRSARRAFEASATVLAQVKVDPSAQRLWESALRAVSAERTSMHELAAAEEALFAIAEPEPLGTVTLTPRSAAESAPHAREQNRAAEQPAPDAPSRSIWQTLIAGVDDDLADTVSRTTTALWRRLRPKEGAATAGKRRAPWVVGGGVAVAVLSAGLLWPSSTGAETRPSSAVAGASPSAEP